MNSNKVGNIGMGNAIQHFTSIGMIVSIPLNDSQSYDLVVEDKGVLKKVQVKTSKGSTIDLRTTMHNSAKAKVKYKLFNNTEFDLLFIVCSSGRFLIPTSSITCSTSISISNKYEKYRIDCKEL